VLVDAIDNCHAENAALFDVRLDKSIRMKGDAKITGYARHLQSDDSNAVTNSFLTSAATYNRIIAALNPRTLQLGVRVTF